MNPFGPSLLALALSLALLLPHRRLEGPPMTACDRTVLMLGAAAIVVSSMLPLLFTLELSRPVLVIDIVLGCVVGFIAWSTEPEDLDGDSLGALASEEDRA